MPPSHALAAAVLVLAAIPALAQPAQPTAVIDTTAGRITCTLFTHDRPATTRRFIALAQNPEELFNLDHSPVATGPFYDGLPIKPHSAGIDTPSRANPALLFPPETTPTLLFDRPALLAMLLTSGNANPSRILITDHANTEIDGRAVIFGQCDAASIPLVATLRHTLQSTDNHPTTSITIDHITIIESGQPLPPPAPHAPTTGATTPLPPPSGPEPTGPTATLDTTAGRISCRLFTSESPIATATFLALADGSKDWTDPRTQTIQHHHPFYDSMPFDRVLPDFYLQFGDITGDITGKTDIGFHFRNEITPNLTFDRPGRLAFGNGGKDTNSSEIFFALNPMHALDNGYTIIGQCDAASIRVLDRIAHLPRDASNHPLTPVVIRRIEIRP